MEANDKVIINSDYGVGTDYVNLKLMYTEKSMFNNFLRSRIKVNALAEEVRMLYVAMTRAEEKLFLTGSVCKYSAGKHGSKRRGKKEDNDMERKKGKTLNFRDFCHLQSNKT